MMKFEERKILGNKSGIYGIKNLVNKKIYIGQTRQPFYKRYQYHDWQLRNNLHDNRYLQNSYNKHGENNFCFIIIECVEDFSGKILDDLEIRYINYYKSKNLSYNILNGGGGHPGVPLTDDAKRKIGEKNRQHMLGRKMSEETKAKMRESSPHRKMTEEQKQILIAANTGRKNTSESIEKMRASHIGSKNKHSVINEEQVYQIKKLLIDGNLLQKEIANLFGIRDEVVSSIARQKVWNHVYVEGFDEYCKSSKKQFYLTKEQVLNIKNDINNKIDINEIAKHYQVSSKVINDIKKGKTYRNYFT